MGSQGRVSSSGDRPALLRRRLLRTDVVVDMGLPLVLLVRIVVRDVLVLEPGMVVLVRMGSRHVNPIFLRAEIVGHVDMLMLVHGLAVTVGLVCHRRASFPRSSGRLSFLTRPSLHPAGEVLVRNVLL